jgi:hypothetical protein
MRVRFVAICFLLCSLTLSAEAAQQGVALYFDQDLFIPVVNQDRDYTMGVGVEFFTLEEGIYPLEGLLKQVGGWLDIDRGQERLQRSYLFGSVNYTPDNLSATAVQPNDRPYASVLFLANKWVLAGPRTAIGVEAQAGLLGTYVAREVQRKVHRAWRAATDSSEPVDPRGWGNQISAGGEPTLRIRVARTELLRQQPGLWDLAGTADLSIGYQTNASIGLAARAGRIGSPFWSLPYDPINRGNFVPAFGSDEIYFWAAGRIRAVAYDALLQGQFRDSVLTYGSDDMNHLVADAGMGATAAWNGLQLTLSANMKTAELNRGNDERTHWWGGVYLGLRY